jgi:hypothetical protein
MNTIRSIFAFDTSIDVEQFASNCREWGINLAILHPGYFDDLRMTNALQRNGVALWLNFPVFYDPEFLATNPAYYSITSKGRQAIHEWCHFVCPNRPEYVDRLLKKTMPLAERLQPAMLSLDFIRHYVFWELVDLQGSPESIEDGCYCPVCLNAFGKVAEHVIPSGSPRDYIRTHAQNAWGSWKTRRITDTATRLIAAFRLASPESAIWIKTVPWTIRDLDGAIINSVGQDIPALGALVDGIAPMAFTHILRQTPHWKDALLCDVKALTGKPVISYVQVEKAYRVEAIPLQQFGDELKAGLEGDYAGISIFCYEQLLQSPEKIEILKTYLRKGR